MHKILKNIKFLAKINFKIYWRYPHQKNIVEGIIVFFSFIKSTINVFNEYKQDIKYEKKKTS